MQNLFEAVKRMLFAKPADYYLFQCFYGYELRLKFQTNMAATPGEESVYDSGRLSLFDVILERTREQNKVKDPIAII